MLVSLAGTLIGQVIGLFGDWGKKKQEQIDARISNMERSWTDEFIVVIFFSPLAVGWFSQERSMAWIAMIDNMPDWYVNVVFAITGAVFGLGKIHGRRK